MPRRSACWARRQTQAPVPSLPLAVRQGVGTPLNFGSLICKMGVPVPGSEYVPSSRDGMWKAVRRPGSAPGVSGVSGGARDACEGIFDGAGTLHERRPSRVLLSKRGDPERCFYCSVCAAQGIKLRKKRRPGGPAPALAPQQGAPCGGGRST